MENDYVFDSDTAVAPDGPHLYRGHLHQRWTIAGVPNGGYAMSAMLQAARQETRHSDPLTATAHFLSPTAAGPIELHSEVVKEGRSTSTIMLGLHQDGRERIRMLTTLGDLSARKGPTHGYLTPPEMKGPFETRRSQLLQEFPTNFEYRVPKAVAGGAIGQPSGEPEIGGTIAFADGRPPDLLCMPVIADGFAPVVFNLGYTNWTPTVEMTVHFWRKPAPGPLTVWLHSGVIEEGFHDESSDIWDSEGHLVARSRQFAMILSP
jgi:acyl-coenzyme A thioesterase PaaI-like protein